MFQSTGRALATPSSNFKFLAPQLNERGAVAVNSKYDFYRNVWGVPSDVADLLNSNDNLRTDDIIGAYRERALQYPSAQLTATMLNSQADWLTGTASPMYPTKEFNFTSSFREMNQIDFTRIAAGGIPNEQTYRVTSWKDKIERVALNARIEMDLQQDPTFGEDLWMFHLAGLAANAMWTIHRTVAHSIVHIAYTNRVGGHMAPRKFDLSRALALEAMAFGVASFDSAQHFRMIRGMRDKIIDFDLVIIPHNAAGYLATLKGESTQMSAQKLQMDPETQRLEWAFCRGAKSVATFTYGEEVMHFVEMPRFRINMERDAEKEQIMSTTVTIGQAIPMHNPDNSWAQFNPDVATRDHLDVQVFHQEKNQGDEARISFTEALESAFVFDDETDDGLSKQLHDFCAYKNQQIPNNKHVAIPFTYNRSANTKNCLEDVNKDKSDCDTPDMDRVNKEKLEEMRGWRDMSPMLTYLPNQEIFKPVNRIGAYMLNVLPNKAILKIVKAIYHSVSVKLNGGYDFDTSMNEFFRLISDLENAPCSREFHEALIEENITRMYDFSSGEPVFSPAKRKGASTDDFGYTHTGKKESLFVNAANLDEWRGNEFGSLDLPRKNNRFRQNVPWGFASLPGIQTIAREANDEFSEWRELGIRAKKVVEFLTILNSIIAEYIGPTEVNDERLTPPWFHVDSPLTVLVDSLRHYRPPVYLAVPRTVNAVNVDGGEIFVNGIDRWTRASLTGALEGRSPDVYYTNTVITALIFNKLDRGTGDVYAEFVQRATSKLQQSIAHNLALFVTKNIYAKDGEKTMSLKVAFYMMARLKEIMSEEEGAKKRDILMNEVIQELMIVLNSNSHATKEKSKAFGDKITKFLSEAPDVPKGFPDSTIVMSVNDVISDIREKAAAKKPAVGESMSTEILTGKLNELYLLRTKADLKPDEEAKMETLLAELESIGYTQKSGFVAPSSEPKIKVDFKQAPITFLRAPIVAGDRFFDYLKRTPNPLVKPADPSVFYEAPLDVINEETINHPAYVTHRKGMRVPFASMPSSHTFRSGLNGVAFNTPLDRYEERNQRRYASVVSNRTRDISDFIGRGFESSGFGADMSEDYSRVRGRRNASFLNDMDDDDKLSEKERKFKKMLEEEKYYGPLDSRYEFMGQMSSPFEQFLFKAITLAPNRMTFHNKIANIGQKVLNVVIFRLFIRHIMGSTVVMKAGKDTLRTAIGHARVWVNTEQRGYSTISASFYLGTWRTNPKGIDMVPYTFPMAFEGGMGVTFMRNAQHFRRPTNAKDSMIAMVVPYTETKYTFPLQMLNLPTYTGVDINTTPYYRKWSGSEYFQFIFNKNSLFEIQGIIEESKENYGNAFDISLTAHRAPVTYLQANGRAHTVEGTGPRGNIRMNIPGAEKTWNGESVNFPDIQSNHLRTF